MLGKGLFNPAALALAGAVKLYAAVLTGENGAAALPDIHSLRDDVQSQIIAEGEIIGGNRGTGAAIEQIVSGADGCKLAVRQFRPAGDGQNAGETDTVGANFAPGDVTQRFVGGKDKTAAMYPPSRWRAGAELAARDMSSQ